MYTALHKIYIFYNIIQIHVFLVGTGYELGTHKK